MNNQHYLRAVLVSVCLALAACGAEDMLPPVEIEAPATPSQPPTGGVLPSPEPGPGPVPGPVPGPGPVPPPPSDPAPPPAPITLNGSPETAATVGTAWSFRPTASNGNGTLDWSVRNMPSWTNFDATTGLLQGVPTESHVGIFPGIVISVTDGVGTATGAEFSITVNARNGTTGSAELSWTAPTERTDGSPIGQLAGYRILYGTASGQYDQFVSIENPGVTQYLVEHLSPGTWYFAVTAVTADKLESTPSQEVNKKLGG